MGVGKVGEGRVVIGPVVCQGQWHKGLTTCDQGKGVKNLQLSYPFRKVDTP